VKTLFPSSGGKEVDKERAAVFYELCEWLDLELEHGVMALGEVYRKLQQLDRSPNPSLAYLKKWLKKLLQERYPNTLCFASQGRWAMFKR